MKKFAIVSSLALCLSSASFLPASTVKEYKQGNVWVRTVIHDDGSRTVSMRDARANEVVKETYAPPREGVEGDILVSRSRFELNPKGDYVRGQVFDRNENLVFVSEFVYDQFGRILEERISDSRGAPVRRLIYKYDMFRTRKGEPVTSPFVIDFENGRATSGPRAVQNADDLSTSSDLGFQLEQRAQAQARQEAEDKEDDDRRRFRIFGKKNDSDSSSNRKKGLFGRRK